MSSSAPPAAGSPRDEHPAAAPDAPESTAPSPGRLAARIDELGPADRRRLGQRLASARKQREAVRRARALTEVERQLAAAERKLFRRAASVPDITFPPELPVSAAVPDLARVIAENQVVIVAGETGSGKSTQLPKLCLQMGRGVRGLIGHTQPRRIAARALAERISEETGTRLGDAIGYTVRFGDHTGPDTLVKLMTDGILLAEIGRDRLLTAYDTIIIDEAHERSLTIDFLLGYLVGLLPRRPDLKVIITSATIDPERFSRHFGDAPIVEVSGRTYPVEIRYRPYGLAAEDVEGDTDDPDDLDDEAPARRPAGRDVVERTDDRDQGQAIVDAVDELCAAGPGDILVFLSGEREITDTTEVLRGHLAGRSGPPVEVLPLYGRLSAADQHRVFDRHTGRRIVLSTNVAETSLTVPGIRYVIDPGTARISRYSPRTKVQRLPIEPISQASAGQRAGRCGRLENGICIRLYSEADFQARPEFTDPEILRTSLASVILQMAALQLGDIETFPFLEPPDRRQVTDGLTVLTELGALAKDSDRSGGPRLTPVGRSMAALPVDPRLARMIVEGHERQCLREVLVIASALSVVDVREYPLDDRDRAKAAHSRFVDPNSDFNALLNLWRYLGDQAKARSGNAFRRMCREEYLHYLRIREWQDLHAQLAHLCRGLKMDPEVESPPLPVARERAGKQPAKDAPATQGGRGSLATDIDTERVHTALLAGLLSHLGQKSEASREYQGTRGTSWVIWPGSALAKKGARLVVAAELVETSRLWGRLCAAVDPVWVERVGGDLLRRSYSEPRWDARRASVVATEKVTLLGVTLIGARTVQFDRIDPEVSRELFLRHALVERDWQTRHAFFAANQQALEEIARWEDRTRRRDIVVDDETLYGLYDARIPADVTSGRHFDSWWKKASRSEPGLLTFTPEMLIAAGAERFDRAAYPDRYTSGELDLPVDYVYDPTRADDGVTISIPLAVLARVEPSAFADQIPGLRSELAVALLRSLPKTLRRNFVPAPTVADAVLARMSAQESAGRSVAGGFPERFARAVTAATGIPVRETDFDLAKVPDHLKLTFAVTDDAGRTVASGKDLAALQAQLRPAADRAVADAVGRDIERSGLTTFPEPGLPRTVTTVVAGQPVTAYPALVAEEPADGSTVGVRILATEAEQSRAMWAATRRLLARSAPMSAKQIRAALTREQVLVLAAPPEGTFADLLRDAIDAAVDALLDWAGGPVWTAADFARLQSRIAPHVQRAVLDVLRAATSVLDEARTATRAIDELTGGRPLRRDDPMTPSVKDLQARLRATVGPGFLLRAGAAGLPDVGRDVRAIGIRARRVRENPERDRRSMAEVTALEQETDGVISALATERLGDHDVHQLRRLLAEYRIAVFAQPMKTVVPVSEKRIRNAVAALRR
ncbi:ATP-dependent RNA helicase HrpA [Nakamurella flava]|uniref:ATP-dependent RNA helicase HrpA n=1 Tax=Nakamurella flava TaxID=2576308 RepID=A0A4U6Q8Z1_9ACTN|nr:ATP-dependent RNA helicase HrpA [Nakamurella flava]TKV56344.1 ATP-dependent RNA helicase HrpA [Nakamurella flava]